MKIKLFYGVTAGVIAVIMIAMPVLSAEPHEDPLLASWEYSGLELFRYYSAVLDKVINGDTDEVVSQLAIMPYANLPSEITDDVETFSKSVIELFPIMKRCVAFLIRLITPTSTPCGCMASI